jgi:hypothetical protein
LINTNERTIVLRTIARFVIGISNDIAKVKAERDLANNAIVNLAPPLMPMDLVKM